MTVKFLFQIKTKFILSVFYINAVILSSLCYGPIGQILIKSGLLDFNYWSFQVKSDINTCSAQVIIMIYQLQEARIS
jgi:hypothetical protein